MKLKERIEQAIDEGLNEMSEMELVRWMCHVVNWWPNDRCRQDMMSVVPIVAEALCRRRDKAERRITLQRIRQVGIELSSWDEWTSEDEEAAQDIELGTRAELYDEAWGALFVVRAEMMSNVCGLSNIKASDLVEMLVPKLHGNWSQVEWIKDDLISVTQVWAAQPLKEKIIEKLVDSWTLEGEASLRDKCSSQKSLTELRGWKSDSALATELNVRHQWIDHAKKRYAEIVAGIWNESKGVKNEE
jgi:hypothetical protein